MEPLSQKRSHLYAALARCFQAPERVFLSPGMDNPLLRSLEELAEDGSCRVFGQVAGELRVLLDEMAQSPQVESLLGLEVEHNRLLAGPGHAQASPCESAWRDPRGLVVGSWAAEVLQQYAGEGLVLSKEFRDCPDHAAAELEFTAYLCWREAEAWLELDMPRALLYHRKQLSFPQAHLCPWVPRFCYRVPGEKIPEVGTGSGYQAAVLGQMGAQVYSVEIISTLAQRARQRLDGSGYRDIQTRVGDGYFGWDEEAPFDGIIVTAAPGHVPPPLLAQLKPTGRMVIPVGPPGSIQTLWLIEQREGQWVSLNQGLGRFVPLMREWPP